MGWLLVPLGMLVVGLLLSLLSKEEDNPITKRKLNNNKINDYLSKLDDIELDKYYISEDNLSGIGIDFNRKQLYIFSTDNRNKIIHKQYSLDDIIESEIVEDGIGVTKTSRAHQFAGAAIGTLLAGGVGTIVGGLSGKKTSTDEVLSIDLRLLVNDIESPVHTINYLTPIFKKSQPKNTKEYREAMDKIRDWHGVMKIIIEQS